MSVRIAVAGAGMIGRRHVENVLADPRAELAAIVDPVEAGHRLAGELGVPWYPDLSGLLGARLADGVILATPNAAHVPGGCEAIAAGLPVLVEKPLANTVEDAQRLVDASEAAQVPVLVGHHRRHSPILQRAARAIEQGAIGRIVAVSGSMLINKPAAYFDAAWRRQKGAGPILINLIHDIDDLRMLVGEITTVQAMASHATRGFEVEDTAALALRFANGALGSFILSDAATSSRSWELTSGENRDYPHQEGEDCYIIAGTRGQLSVPTLRLWTNAGEQPDWFEPLDHGVLEVRRTDPLANELANFIQVIRGEAEPVVTAREGMRTLAATLAVAEAAATGRPVGV